MEIPFKYIEAEHIEFYSKSSALLYSSCHPLLLPWFPYIRYIESINESFMSLLHTIFYEVPYFPVPSCVT